MRLSARLEMILSAITPSESLADIGCDHAFLLIELVNRNKIQRGIGIDNKIGPLNIAKRNLEKAGLTDSIKLLHSEGAENLEETVDAWVIAGIGGENALDIIQNSIEKAQKTKEIVLSPHSKVSLVRRTMALRGFTLVNESLIMDEQFYHVLNFHYTGIKKMISLKEEYFGQLQINERTIAYFEHLLSTYEMIYSKKTTKDTELKNIIDLISRELSKYPPQEGESDD